MVKGVSFYRNALDMLQERSSTAVLTADSAQFALENHLMEYKRSATTFDDNTRPDYLNKCNLARFASLSAQTSVAGAALAADMARSVLYESLASGILGATSSLTGLYLTNVFENPFKTISRSSSTIRPSKDRIEAVLCNLNATIAKKNPRYYYRYFIGHTDDARNIQPDLTEMLSKLKEMQEGTDALHNTFLNTTSSE